MSKYFAGLALVGLFGASGFAWADEMPKGPDEDGTKPALTRIAGEGMMNSHAFQYLTELSDDIGSRVTGTPAERKAEEWAAAKMKATRSPTAISSTSAPTASTMPAPSSPSVKGRSRL